MKTVQETINELHDHYFSAGSCGDIDAINELEIIETKLRKDGYRGNDVLCILAAISSEFVNAGY